MGSLKQLGRGPVALDTSIFIYYIEEDERFLPLVEPLFKAIDDGKLSAVTSMLTLLEVMVIPYRNGAEWLAQKYEALLTRSRRLLLVRIDETSLRTAAQLRAKYSLKTPDALQVSAALLAGCTAFLTNDRALPIIAGLDTIQLRDLL